MKFGILYVATGADCCAEAIDNAKRTHIYNPNLPISIKTDKFCQAKSSGEFTTILSFEDPSFSYRDKIVGLQDLPFEITLFLDSDACLISSADEFFNLTTNFDLAAVTAPVRHPPGWSDCSVPLLFPELNTGVLLIRRTAQWDSLVNSWLKLYDDCFKKYRQTWDQATFRSVIWQAINSDKYRFLNLPLEANLRTTKPWVAGRGMPVFVIHGRYPAGEFNKFVDYLNDDIDRFRTWIEWLNLYPESQIRPRHDRTFN